MLKEREILEQWVLQTINNPENKKPGKDGNMHYFRLLSERENRILDVVVNEQLSQTASSLCFWTGEKGEQNETEN